MSQTEIHNTKLNQTLFDNFCRYLDASITNRNFFFLKEIKVLSVIVDYRRLSSLQASYEHLNPDVELLSDGVRSSLSRRELLDNEFWFVQKLSRLLELANFREMSRDELERWLTRPGGYGAVPVFLEAGEYELLKVWVLGGEGAADIRQGRVAAALGLGRHVASLIAGDNPFKLGQRYRRVAVVVREKRGDRVGLKLFKDLWQGELLPAMPAVQMRLSPLDRAVLLTTGALLALGAGTHLLLLPVATVESGWLLASSHQLASSLAIISAGVAFLNWHVVSVCHAFVLLLPCIRIAVAMYSYCRCVAFVVHSYCIRGAFHRCGNGNYARVHCRSSRRRAAIGSGDQSCITDRSWRATEAPWNDWVTERKTRYSRRRCWPM